MTARLKPIGGFFELHEPESASGHRSVLDVWTEGMAYAAFSNARSALAALIAEHPASVVWLPAFICTDLLDRSYSARIGFYPVLDGFQPDLGFIDRQASSGDLVLVVAYFGQAAGMRTRDLSRCRPDLQFIEDRAQALDAGDMWSRWCLYSPRKLLGVADGGLLVARDPEACLPRPTTTADAVALWKPALQRYEDPAGERNEGWHRANQVKEAALSAGGEGMTRLSRSILTRTSLRDLASRRFSNWRTLDAVLRPWSALPADIAAPPLGYVIRLQPELRDAVLRALYVARIFPSVHWAQIAAPAALFPREHGWTRELLTLPCDHRYSTSDMDRVAERVRELLQ